MLNYYEEDQYDPCASSLIWAFEFFLEWKRRRSWTGLINNFKLLRVLEFKGLDYGGKLLNGVGDLIHLRFLNLSHYNSEDNRIPSSLANLRCLQTLDLRVRRRYYLAVYVPDVIWKLEQLRHLYLPKKFYLHDENKLKLHTLRNLLTLINFNTEKCSVGDLSKLTNLRKLKIYEPFHLEDFEEYLDQNLPIIAGKCLRSLSIHIYHGSMDPKAFAHLLSSCVNLCELSLECKMKRLPECLHFSSNLAYICIKECYLEEDPMPTLEKLPNLRFLELQPSAVNVKEMVFSASHFPQLDSLVLKGLQYLEEIKVEEGVMPALRHLEIIDCLNLKMLPDGLRFIANLQELKIERMPKRFTDRMVIGGEDFYKIQHVPSIVFSDA